MTKKKFNPVYILLAVIILLQLIWTSYVFIFQKQGNHSDEIWSYGLANSYYKPFIYLKPDVNIDTPTETDYDNTHEWITGETFKNYITVQENERFAYGSVYSNQTYDHHPPLYYALLHTVCSLFPNKFSFGFGFFLNCIFLIITQIYLFKLAKNVSKSDMIALITCFFYGGTLGALCTFIFIRQYSLLTMFVTMYVYYNARLYSDFNLKKNLAPVLLSAFGCFMTHYYGIIMVGVFTACMCIYMLIKRYFKKMFIYGFSTLAALGFYFLVYPASISQMLNNEKTSSTGPFTYFTQLKIYFNRVTKNLFNFHISVLPTGNMQIFIAAIICIIILLIPICFLFRNEEWFKKFKSNIPVWFKRFGSWLKGANYIPLFSIIISVAMLCVVNKIVDISSMGEYSLRYIFHIFPLVSFAAVIAFTKILSIIPKIKKASSVIAFICASALVVSGNISQTNHFLFENFPDDINLKETLDGKNCVCVVAKGGDWLLTCFSNYLYDADNVFFTTYASLDDDLDEIKSKGINIDYVLTSSYEFEGEDKIKAGKWYNSLAKGTQTTSNSVTVVDEDGTYNEKNQKIEEHNATLTESINSINDNKGTELVGYCNIVNGYVYILKCK